jgi:hypothetical protein
VAIAMTQVADCGSLMRGSQTKKFTVSQDFMSRVLAEKPFRLSRKANQQKLEKISMCKTCIDFADQALDQLINIILNVGVLGSCGDLCSILAKTTDKPWLGAVCDILCDIAGIEEFINLIEKADIDPIWYCEMLKTCPVNDHGDANITSFTVSPPSVKRGSTFVLALKYTSLNGTGTGEMFVEIKTVDGIPIEAGFLMESQKPGNYQENLQVKAAPDPDCDPSQQPCEQWEPGTYDVKIALCNGECGSKHPHSKIYSEAQAKFTVTP